MEVEQTDLTAVEGAIQAWPFDECKIWGRRLALSEKVRPESFRHWQKGGDCEDNRSQPSFLLLHAHIPIGIGGRQRCGGPQHPGGWAGRFPRDTKHKKTPKDKRKHTLNHTPQTSNFRKLEFENTSPGKARQAEETQANQNSSFAHIPVRF